MIKYNLDFKIKVVKEFFDGCGSTTLSKKYDIPNHSTIMEWVHTYQLRGAKGLRPRKVGQRYSGMFKVEVLNWKNQNMASFSETALHFNIPAGSTVYKWQNKFESNGINGLRHEQDILINMNKNVKHNSENHVSKEEELKQLKKENLMLKVENEFLKKVDALAQKKSKQKKSQK
ncbi:helix-turn-helix domain-containing protein [Companilactobacillus muriivasis]|uniref:helix-turn-helix domain-containing protein n=1 Tax=Companilactobacillus muriivasis TaxID=3081444 RepID=UPI0030C75781